MGIETFYNAQEGTVLGRTCGSWTKILGFYLVYYTFLGFLFYGSVQVGMLRIDSQEILGKTRGVGKPVINTRTDQPGVDAWPQNMLIEDTQGLEFPLDEFKKTYGDKKDQYPTYVQKLESYLLNACPFEGQYCALNQFFGDKWSENEKLNFLVAGNDATEKNVNCADSDFSRKCMIYRGCKTGDKCGKLMKIDYSALKKVICASPEEGCMINKPLFFIALNKVIGFEIQTVGSLDFSKGDKLNPKNNEPSPVWQHDLSLMKTLTEANANDSFAFVNCYIMDQDKEKSKCKPWTAEGKRGDGEQVDCDNKKDLSTTITNQAGKEVNQTQYKINAIYPYIKNSDYAYAGFSASDNSQNKKSAEYVKPFAVYQLENTSTEPEIAGVLKSKDDKSLVRCNVLAENIQYPFIADDNLMGNALLSQPGHGWVQLGFKTSEKKED